MVDFAFAMGDKWELRMSHGDILNNKKVCPNDVVDEIRLKLDVHWEGTAIRVVEHIEKDNGWAVNTKFATDSSIYIAMSYCWKCDSPEVSVEGIGWRVGEWNLEVLLRVYRNICNIMSYCKEEKLCLGSVEDAQSVSIWCDAVCINQKDGGVEKKNQVPIMGKIYRRAECTVVPCAIVDFFPSVQDILDNDYVRNHDVLGTQHVSEGTDDLFRDGYMDKMWTWFRQLALENWWSRQWTLQEACCSKTLLFMAKNGSTIDASVLYTLASIVRDCLSLNVLDSAKYNDLQAVNRMVAQFLPICLTVCVAKYCPLLPAADVLTLSQNRMCKCKEDHVYALLGMTSVSMKPEYGIGLGEATKMFYNSCIAQGDHSVMFCVGSKLHRWQMRIDSDRVFYRSDKYCTSVEQGVKIDLVDDGKLMFSFNGEYSATPMQCVYKEDKSISHLQMTRFYRILKASIRLNFGIVESLSMFDSAGNNHIVMMCFVVIASIGGNEMLDTDYVDCIFKEMKKMVKNSGPYLEEHKDDLLVLLSNPQAGKGEEWMQGQRILQLVAQCELTKDVPKNTYRYYMNTYRIITHFEGKDACTVVLAVIEGYNGSRLPLCLAVSNDSALVTGDNLWAVPTGYSTSYGEPLVLAGLCRQQHTHANTNIEAEYIGVPVARRGLSFAIRKYAKKYRRLIFT